MYKNGEVGDCVRNVSNPHMGIESVGVITQAVNFVDGKSYFVRFPGINQEFFMFDDEIEKLEDPNELLKEIL